ncbi:hypothetical protein GCM10023314_11660 [Algibacter agarivorans]|uniref:Uncharacterized protein n=1 Tax=Algibacter agarivorans TaxID=1109741 RepID=A0ABP9GEN4_9FLAO
MMIFETVNYWKQFDIPILDIDNYHYIHFTDVNNILAPVELKLSDDVYISNNSKLLNTKTNACTGITKNEGIELFVPIELLNKFIIAK